MSELKVYVKPLKTNILGQTIVGQSYYLKSEADKVIAHQKYRRCMAMARWCMARYNEWVAYYPTMTTRKMKFLDKWEKRWRELAEKFKEAK